MRKIFTANRSVSVLAALIALFAVSVPAQPALRKALDVDADGKADFTVFRPSTNVWYTAKSSGGFAIQAFGIANDDFLTPGDYDNDGKGDISVWRDSSGVHYRIDSST